MQFTLFALIALCSSVLAAPPVARSSPSLIGVGVDVENIANNLTVKVLSTRDDGNVAKRFEPTVLERGDSSSASLIGVGVEVENIANNLTVKVLSTRDDDTVLARGSSGSSSSGSLIGVGVGKYRLLKALVIFNTNPTDVSNILNNATVKVLST
ncbi:hypothetical protein M405DRAFT_855791 [Rhizopogon salebrosus TDB-379]|nr:hypothetical protein M405DRAFT_855791 [Rhizopogon salebrosus TDB-379]